MKKQSHKTSVGTKVAIGVTIAAATAAAYMLFGPNGKKNRKVVRGWSVKMKGKIIEKFEKAKNLSEETYHSIVDQVITQYAKIKNVDQKELASTVADIRKHWKAIVKNTTPKKKMLTKTTTKKRV